MRAQEEEQLMKIKEKEIQEKKKSQEAKRFYD